MKRISLLALLAMFSSLLMSCGEQPGEPITILVPTGPGAQLAPGLDLDDLEYETISGTLADGQGGIMTGYMPNWGAKALFGLVVPQSSMPSGYDVTFTMSVPTVEMYEDDVYGPLLEDWLVIRLGPTPQNFLGPITVIGTWMPWDSNGPPVPLSYYYNGQEVGEVEVEQVGARWRLYFDVDHFSDWETGPEPPAPPPGG
ncbi:MAG TPA: hypothetical protein VKU85_14515 [bacterium]|nr:hypothetical protein [bacterium]